jgi:hypothetical protein
MFKKVWGRRLGDAVGNDVPEHGMNKTHPQMLDPVPFGGRFGGYGWRCSCHLSPSMQSTKLMIN